MELYIKTLWRLYSNAIYDSMTAASTAEANRLYDQADRILDKIDRIQSFIKR